MGVWKANFLASRSVCKASSRVGERTRQRGDGGCARSSSSAAWYSKRFDKIGKRNAAYELIQSKRRGEERKSTWVPFFLNQFGRKPWYRPVDESKEWYNVEWALVLRNERDEYSIKFGSVNSLLRTIQLDELGLTDEDDEMMGEEKEESRRTFRRAFHLGTVISVEVFAFRHRFAENIFFSCGWWRWNVTFNGLSGTEAIGTA